MMYFRVLNDNIWYKIGDICYIKKQLCLDELSLHGIFL